VPLWHEDPRHLAQHLVRIVAELQDVRQQDQIGAVGEDRKLGGFGSEAYRAMLADATTERHAGCTQEGEAAEPELESVETEDVDDLGGEVGLLGGQEILP